MLIKWIIPKKRQKLARSSALSVVCKIVAFRWQNKGVRKYNKERGQKFKT